MNNNQSNQQKKTKRSAPAKPAAGKSKSTAVVLGAIGGLVLLVGLIVGGILLFGGGEEPAGGQQAEETGEEASGEPAAAEEGEAATDGDGGAEETAPGPAEDGQTTVSREDFDPGSLLFGLIGGVEGGVVPAGATAEPEPVTYPEDPAVARQTMVDLLAARGISEAAMADFFAAYDTLTDPGLAEKLAALSDEEFAAAVTSVETAVEPSLENLALCLEPLFAVSLEIATDPELEGDPALIEAAIAATETAREAMACATDSMNELGRQIIAGLRANGLLGTAAE